MPYKDLTARKKFMRDYANSHKEEIAAQKHARYIETKDAVREQQKLYRKKNRAKVRARNRKYEQEQRANSVGFRLRANLRSRLNQALRTGARAGSAVRDLGCTISELRAYLEKLFQPGMTWKNWGAWHIDHIRPLAGFDLTDRKQFLEACHYTNLQPLWAEENLRKSSAR